MNSIIKKKMGIKRVVKKTMDYYKKHMRNLKGSILEKNHL
jgi:hypothetical protein